MDNEASLHTNTRVIFGINNIVLILNLLAIVCGICVVLHQLWLDKKCFSLGNKHF